MRALVLVFSFVALLAAGAAHAQDKVYRWKDADGITHYSDEPPAEGSAEEMEVNVPPPVAAPPASEADEEAEAQRESEAADAEAAERLAAENQQACEDAQRNLATLQANPEVSMDTDADGEPEILTPEQRDAQIAANRAAIESYCTRQ